jgi:broad specificity phosphatase PhoE
MKLILFRHAHKGFIPFDDPELSAQGFEQSLRLLELVRAGQIPTPHVLLVSPKRRTSQTFYPISRDFGLKIEIQPELDQHITNENNSEFRKRIQNFINSVENFSQNSNVYVCTHYDWIEESMTLINCDKDLNSFEFSHWSPTQYIIFEIEDRLWKFVGKGSAK